MTFKPAEVNVCFLRGALRRLTAAKIAIILIDVTEKPKSKDVFAIAGRVLPETAVVYFTAKTVG